MTVRTASAATRKFFEVLSTCGVSQQEIADKAGVHVNTFYGWKTGKASAGIPNMEAALAVLGYELTIRPINSEPGATT